MKENYFINFYNLTFTLQSFVQILVIKKVSCLTFGVIFCVKYEIIVLVINFFIFLFFFYLFIFQITFIFMVMLVGFRLDVVALIYATWLLFLINCSRSTLSRIWYFLNWFAALTIPLQYAVIVGLPPSFCFCTQFSTLKM